MIEIINFYKNVTSDEYDLTFKAKVHSINFSAHAKYKKLSSSRGIDSTEIYNNYGTGRVGLNEIRKTSPFTMPRNPGQAGFHTQEFNHHLHTSTKKVPAFSTLGGSANRHNGFSVNPFSGELEKGRATPDTYAYQTVRNPGAPTDSQHREALFAKTHGTALFDKNRTSFSQIENLAYLSPLKVDIQFSVFAATEGKQRDIKDKLLSLISKNNGDNRQNYPINSLIVGLFHHRGTPVHRLTTPEKPVNIEKKRHLLGLGMIDNVDLEFKGFGFNGYEARVNLSLVDLRNQKGINDFLDQDKVRRFVKGEEESEKTDLEAQKRDNSTSSIRSGGDKNVKGNSDGDIN